jgi:hypothetical protein
LFFAKVRKGLLLGREILIDEIDICFDTLSSHHGYESNPVATPFAFG